MSSSQLIKRVKCLSHQGFDVSIGRKTKPNWRVVGGYPCLPNGNQFPPLFLTGESSGYLMFSGKLFFKKSKGKWHCSTAEHNTAPPIVRPLSLSKEEEGKVLLSPNAPFSSFQATAEWADSLLFYRGFSLQRAFY